MAFPKFHGIPLANTSVLENLHIERLAADPVPATAGRLWVNTTEKKVKFTGLDENGAVVVHSFGSAAELASSLAEAKAYTDAAITNLRGVAPELLDTLGEIAAALNNDPDVYNTLVAMIGTNIEAAKAELRGAVSETFDTLAELEAGLVAEQVARSAADTAEANARTAADTTLQNNISAVAGDLAAETAAREAADTALDGRLTTVESQASGKIGDLTTLTTTVKTDLVSAINEVDADLAAEVSARTAAVSAEQTAREAADATLTTNLAAEVSRAQAAEGTLTTNLAAEASARQAADSTLTTNLAAEVSRAQAAEGTLTTNLAAEVSRAQAAETQLQSNIDAEATARQTADTAEAAARTAADQSIRDDVNAGKFTFASASAALVHTVQHDLNTSPVLVSVYVEGDDGKFRNDIVAVEETNNNTITIGLTESRKVKVAVLSLAAI